MGKKIPQRLPCVFLKSNEKSLVIPLPGVEVNIGQIQNGHLREALATQKAFLIPYVYVSESSKVWCGVYARVIEMGDAPGSVIGVKSEFRVRLKSTPQLNSLGYAESEWERIEDVAVKPREFFSKEFQRELFDLATLAYIVTRQYEYNVFKGTFLVRSEEYSEEGIGLFIDRIAHLLNASFREKEIHRYLGEIISEKSVRGRLRKAIEAYRSLVDEKNEFEILYPEESCAPYAREEDLGKIPRQLFHILLSPSAKKVAPPIPFPGFFGSVEGVGGGIEMYLCLRNAPYFIFDLVDPVTGEKGDVGMLMRVYAIHREHDYEEFEIIVETLARVRVTYPSSADSKVAVAAWKPYQDKHFTPEECMDEGFLRFFIALEAISKFVRILAEYCRSKNLSDISQKFLDAFYACFESEEGEVERMRDRFKRNPKQVAEFIDSQVSVLNEFSSTIPGVYTHIYGIVRERDVRVRLSLAFEALGSIIESIQQEIISENTSRVFIEAPTNPDCGEFPKARRTIVASGDDVQNVARVPALPAVELGNEGMLDGHTRSAEAKRLNDFLESKIVGEGGQRRAIDRIVDAYELYLSPLWRPEVPIFSGLFLGPSGVGKTEIAKKLAEFFSDNEHGLTKVACGNYQLSYEVTSKLIGAPPGYIGFDDRPQLGQDSIDRYGIEKRIRELEEKIGGAGGNKEEIKKIREEQENLRLQLNPVVFMDGKAMTKRGYRSAEDAKQQPFFSVVLFDEIEKAHPNLRKFLLEVFAEGGITLSNGEKVSFHHSFILMTSNLAARDIADAVSGGNQTGFKTPPGVLGPKSMSDDELYRMVMHKIKKILEPEFLGRIQENIIMFSSLKFHETELIRDRQLTELSSRLREVFAITLTVTKEAGAFILQESIDHPEYGVRLLESKIRHFIEMPLSRLINTGQIKKGDCIVVRLDGVGREAKLVFYRESNSSNKDGNL